MAHIMLMYSIFRHVEMKALADELSQPGRAVIALIDWNLIKCSHCGDEIMPVSGYSIVTCAPSLNK